MDGLGEHQKIQLPERKRNEVLEVQLIESYDPTTNLFETRQCNGFEGTLPSPRSSWPEQLRNSEKLKSTSTTLDASTT